MSLSNRTDKELEEAIAREEKHVVHSYNSLIAEKALRETARKDRFNRWIAIAALVVSVVALVISILKPGS